MHNYNPKLWGPSAWTFLMYIAMAYPDNPSNGEKEYMKLFLKSMGNVELIFRIIRSVYLLMIMFLEIEPICSTGLLRLTIKYVSITTKLR